MSNTPEQDRCIQRLTGPIDISAGAGSGKTYTLTQRIAAALEDPTSGVDSIEQVCAITFTKKAAAELKGRVRAILRERGMFEESLKVDGAWISTIHGMCSRILRTHALELGYDPAFSVGDDAYIKDLRLLAIEQAIREFTDINHPSAEVVEEMVSQFGVRTHAKSFSKTSLSDYISNLMDKAISLPNGYDDFFLVRNTEQDSANYKLFLEKLNGIEEADAIAFAEKGKESKNGANLANAQTLVLDFLDMEQPSFEDEAFFLAKLPSFSKTACTAYQKEAIDSYRAYKAELDHALLHKKSEVFLECLIAMAKRASDIFASLKREESIFDNNDLVKAAYLALQKPEIRRNYENRFRMVMVDEFQDTDVLQLAIVDCICGENRRYLCTVGDAQQSIYAFRGADIGVYRQYRASYDKQDLSDNKLYLTKNFRSHADVLAFVKQVCSQREVFGDEFLDLSAGRTSFKEVKQPRVTSFVSLGKNNEGRRSETTRRIVTYFQQMKDEGFNLSDMALLLGKMTNASMYATALQEAGFDCVISKGSLFAKSEEAQMISCLARALVNPKDTDALLKVLVGPLFGLTPEQLLCLTTRKSPEGPVRQSLDVGFWRMISKLGTDQEAGLHEEYALEPLDELLHALFCLRKAIFQIRHFALSDLVEGVLQDSGWLAEMQEAGPSGTASAANAYKAIRFLRDIEAEGSEGPVTVALTFQNMIEQGIVEPPGALNVAKQESITLMTIHASKGLEFPVVAVADFDKKCNAQSGLLFPRLQGKQFVLLKLGGYVLETGGKFTASKLEKEDSSSEEQLTLERLHTLSAVNQVDELIKSANDAEYAETQRLFYVAATRAEECLAVFANAQPLKKGTKVELISADVVHAFCSEEDLTPGSQLYELPSGAQMPLCVTLCDPEEQTQESPDEEEEANNSMQKQQEVFEKPKAMRKLPQITERKRLKYSRLENVYESQLFSYSSVSGLAQADVKQTLVVLADACVFGCNPADDNNGSSNEHAENTAKLSRSLTMVCVEDDDYDVAQTGFHAMADRDKATDFGSALHRLCQLAVLRDVGFARKAVPVLSKTYGVKDVARLEAALERWFESNIAKQAFAYSQRFAEYPFCEQLGSRVLQGEIDLLCIDEDSQGKHAFVVDYKTGGYFAETPDELCKKHVLQASYYAYALLKQGFDYMEFVFVRVEQDDITQSDTLQSVKYRFDKEQLSKLENLLLCVTE